MRRVFNALFIIINTLIIAFCSFVWIGNDQRIELIRWLPYFFITRFIGLATIAFIGTIVLLFLNFLLDKMLSKDINISAFKKLGVQSLKITMLTALLGNILFFVLGFIF